MASKERKFRFVNIDNPTQLSRQFRRQVRSHVARETYGKARRARMKEYLKESEGDRKDADKFKTRTQETVHGPPVQDTPSTGSSLVTLLSANRQDPFNSFAVPIHRIEHFLLDHCKYLATGRNRAFGYVDKMLPTVVNIVIHRRSEHCPSLTSRQDAEYYKGHMTTEWIPFTVRDPELLPSIFLGACRDLAMAYVYEPLKQMFENLAIKYKVICIRALATSLGSKSLALDDAAVVKAIALTNDEVRTALKPG